MKKGLQFLLALGLVAGCVGCTSTNNNEGKEDTNQSDQQEEEGTTQMINPYEMISLDDFKEELGMSINLTDEFTNFETNTINVEGEKIYELNFDYEGNSYSYRLQKTDELVDISGMYFEYTSTNTMDTGNGTQCTISTTDEGQGIVLWYQNGYSQSISASENATIPALYVVVATLSAGCTFE